jgi:hypothetical protein
MRMQTLLLLLSLFIFTSAMAAEESTVVDEPEEVTDFKSIDWAEGVHLIAGVGLNFASYDSDERTETLGFGSNFRSDVGYYLENGLGLELSGSVMFNRIPAGLIWNSAFMLGVRFAVPPLIDFENVVPYMRVFVGRTVGVVNFDGQPPAPFDSAQRLQLEGRVYGLGLGHFQRSETGRVWYVELTIERHEHQKLQAIQDVNGVPTVISQSDALRKSALYALCLTFGVIAF